MRLFDWLFGNKEPENKKRTLDPEAVAITACHCPKCHQGYQACRSSVEKHWRAYCQRCRTTRYRCPKCKLFSFPTRRTIRDARCATTPHRPFRAHRWAPHRTKRFCSIVIRDFRNHDSPQGPGSFTQWERPSLDNGERRRLPLISVQTDPKKRKDPALFAQEGACISLPGNWNSATAIGC